MEKGIKLIIVQGAKSYDITNLVIKVSWKGRKGSSSRSLTATIVDDDGFHHARSGLNVEEGPECLFSYNGKELFRGVIQSQSQSNSKEMTLTAYDNGIFLANNKDTFTFENKTASEIFTDVCARFGLPVGEVSKCSYVIPELTKPSTTAFDVIADALSLDFDATGIRHYVSSHKGKLSLLTRRENILQWVIETGQNLSSYTYSKSVGNIKTRIKMLSDEGTVLAEEVNNNLEKKLGVYQDIEKPDETLTAAQIQELCKSILEEKSTPERTLSLEAVGIPEVISGVGVFIIIKHLGLNRTFYVDEDNHSFEGNKHTMNLKLNYANDISKKAKSSGENSSKEFKIGDVVQFNGGFHYVSSTASSPTGTKCSPGPAKITVIAKGAKHPWHLIHTDNSSRVFGWVDDGTFS